MKINKKGFTLIELLIVIAVLGIVLSVGSYFAINSIKNSKSKAVVLSEQSVMESARIYSVEDPNLGWKKKETDGSNVYFCTTVYELQNKGLLPSKISNEDKYNRKYIILQKNDTTKVIKNIKIVDVDESDGKFCIDAFGNVNLQAPVITANDGITTNNWHNKETIDNVFDNLKLTIANDNNPSGTTYKYWINNDSSNKNDYNPTNKISVSTADTSGITYSAIPCYDGICHEDKKTTYVVKIDKVAPTIEYTISHELTAEEKKVMGVTEQKLEHDLIEQTSPIKNYYSYNETESSYLAWLAYDIKINFSIGDSGSGLNAIVKYGKSGDDSTSITSLTTTIKTPSLSNNGTQASFNDKITANGYKRVYLRACDVAGNCTEKNIYFKIDKKLPEITRTDNGTGNNSFTCTSGLAEINRFFATGDSDNSTHEYDVNGSTSTGTYWLDDSEKGHIYLTCSSKSFNFITEVPEEHWSDWGRTGYRPNILAGLITNGTYSYKPKSEGGTCYKWGCTRFGATGYRPIYTASSRNPYGEHCRKESEYECGTSSCPEGFGDNPKSKGCYSFGTYEA